MTYRFDGGDTNRPELASAWSRRRQTAIRVEQAAKAIRVRPGGDTVIGATHLIDALDRYWQERYGGRVVIVSGPGPDER